MVDITVLVNKPVHEESLARLQDEVQVLTPYDASEEELIALLQHVHGLVLGAGLHMGSQEMGLASNLVVIGRHGVGLDNVDLAAATSEGIPVVYTPYGPTESTAEHALMLMLSTARRVSQLDRGVRSGDFSLRNRAECMGYELEGKSLGVVGFGRIGRRVAAMCRDALHMKVFVYDPGLDAAEVSAWGAVPKPTLNGLAQEVDVLSVHTPLTQATRGLISSRVIGAMKAGAMLINTSRGPVVDEAALSKALAEGHLAGAGLDVYDPQPPAEDNPLLHFDHVVLTPHVGSFTHEGRRRMGAMVVDGVLSVLQGRRPKYLANPQVWPGRRRLGEER